jgi:hypothetical protein
MFHARGMARHSLARVTLNRVLLQVIREGGSATRLLLFASSLRNQLLGTAGSHAASGSI